MNGTHEVTFPLGERIASIAIPIVDDRFIELDEVFSVEITAAEEGEINQGKKKTTVTIKNNDGK